MKTIVNKFNNLLPFKYIDDIPEIPIVDKELYSEIIVPNLIRCGAIPKSDLEVGKTYIGSCRNSDKGTWNGEEFDIKRYKFGFWQDDSVQHFEDGSNNEYDCFVPIKKY